LGVDFIGLDIDDVHLLTNALKGGFCAESGNVGTNETVSVFGNRLEVNVL
jgi:hypothetical protein